jgi:hypothetical protein
MIGGSVGRVQVREEAGRAYSRGHRAHVICNGTFRLFLGAAARGACHVGRADSSSRAVQPAWGHAGMVVPNGPIRADGPGHTDVKYGPAPLTGPPVRMARPSGWPALGPPFAVRLLRIETVRSCWERTFYETSTATLPRHDA